MDMGLAFLPQRNLSVWVGKRKSHRSPSLLSPQRGRGQGGMAAQLPRRWPRLGEKALSLVGDCTSCQWPGGLLSGASGLQLLSRQPAAQGPWEPGCPDNSCRGQKTESRM